MMTAQYFDSSMNISPKQRDLISGLFAKVKAKYPEISLLRLGTSPEDSQHIWIYVLAPMPEEREIELSRYASALEADILVDEDVQLSIMTKNPTLQAA
jgi:hypothetical protein